MMTTPRKPWEELLRDSIRARVAPGLTVLNKDGSGDGPAVVRLYGEIDSWFGIGAEEVAAQLDEITASEIEVQIASLGGSVFEGIAIFNALRAHPARVTTRVDSMAASIASVIVQAGDERLMLTGSQMMIHEAWGLVWGFADDMRKTADILDQQTDIIAAIYAERSGGDAADFRELMDGETWFTADEAIAAGLADRTMAPPRQDTPADRAPRRFTDHLDTVVTAIEKVADETESVVTFRVSQGKPPLSEDAVALLDRLAAAVDRVAVLTATAEPEAEDNDDESLTEWLRFVDITQGV